MGIVAILLCLLATSLPGNGQSAIQTLMNAVEERHNAAEKVYETAFKLANDYHTEVMSSSDAFFYSTGIEMSEPHVGYKDQVAGKRPTYHFDYWKEHFGDALPMRVWGYVTDSNPTVTAQRAQAAATRRQDAITVWQTEIDSISALEYPSSEDLPTGSYSCYDQQKLNKAYWEWWAAARKTMIETGQKASNFQNTDLTSYVSQMEAHPDNPDRNAAARALWNDKRARDLAMNQRGLASCQAPIQAFPSDAAKDAADEAYDDALSAWNDDATAWYEQKEQDAADAYLDAVQATQTELPVLYNSASVRKGAEKFVYLNKMKLSNNSMDFWPCGASFQPADPVWTYPNPQTMEQQIATLNEISKHLVRLSGFYFSEGEFGVNDVDPNPLLFSHQPSEFMPAVGIVTIDNYQEKILEICDRLKAMNRLIWPMLKKSFELNRLNEPGSLSGGTPSLDFGEGATVTHLARWAYDGPYTPYDIPQISFSSEWVKYSNSGAFLPEESSVSPVPSPRWSYSSGSANDFRTITSTSYPLKLITKVGSRNVRDFSTALDGWRSKNRGVFQGSSSFVGDEKVDFTAEMGVVGSAFQADPSDDPWEITQKQADHLAKRLEIRWKRSYPNGGAKAGLLEQFNIPFEITSIGQDEYDLECKAPFQQYLPSVGLGDNWGVNVKGTAFLSCEPAFSVQVPEPSRLMSPAVAEPFVTPIAGAYSLVFPLSYHERQGDVSPRLVLSLTSLGGVPSYTAGSVEFMKQQHPVGGLWGCMSILGSRHGIKVQRGSVPSVTGYLASDGSSYSPVTFPEYIFGGERLAVPVSRIDFPGGKIEIEWTSPHHFELKYFVGTSATPHNTYEVSVGGVSAGQVVELWGTATYPSGFETVTINKNSDLWAKVISLGDGSPLANTSDDARVRVEYYNASGQVEKRISSWSGSDPTDGRELIFSKIAFSGEDPVDSISKIDPGHAFGQLGYDVISYGNRSITGTEFTLPFLNMTEYKLPDQGAYETGIHWYFDPLPAQEWRHLPLFREPETLDFSGSGWSRDGEQMVFNQGGLLTEHTYKVAGLDMESNVALSGNVVNRGTSVEGTSFSTSSETYSDELSRVTRVAGGVETTVEYYSAAGSAVPWSVKSISDPTGTRSYSYAKNGNGDLTVTETLDPNGSDPNTVSTTVLNAFGMLVSKEVKHGGITIASASASGHSSNPFQRPTSVTFFAGGVTRTQSLQYHSDGSLKKLNYGDGRVDDFEWDVLGRINTGSKIDSRNLTPSYNGFSNSFTLGDETAASETDAYGKLQELTSTVGAGLSVTKGSGDVFTSTITGENRGFEQTLLPDGFPSVIGGGAGSPGTGISYSAATINGTHCIAVTSTVLASGEGTQVTQKSYYDGYGRLRRVEQPHPMGTGTVNTDYAYDMGARTVTITPPSPAKPILIEYDAGWKNAVITQGGTEIEVLSSAVAGTVTRIVKNGGREIFSSESSLATGEVVSKVNGRNAITSSPSPDGNTVSVTGPNGLDFEATYNRYGLSGMAGDVAGESFSTLVSRNGKGEIQTIALDPPGPQSATTFSFSEAGRLTGATGAGTNLGVSYNFAGGGVKATGNDSASSTGFVVAEDAEGHPRQSESTGRDALAMGGNALDGEVTLSATGFANQAVTYTVGPTLLPLNKERADGSSVSYSWHGDGSLAGFTRYDGAGNGGGSHSFTMTTDPGTGLATGYTGTSSSLVIAPNADGTIASAQYQSQDIDLQSQTYSVQYPSYFDDSPLVETFGGSLAGYEVKRNYNAATGEPTRVELYKNSVLVHAVDYTADGRSQIGTVTASTGKSFSATYGYPTAATETLTSGTVTATRTFLGDGTGRLSSVSTSAGGGTYSAAYGFNGQRRDSLTLSSPSQPSAVWDYTFQNAVASTGQLQSAASSQGTSYTYNHDAAGNRAGSSPNPANQYTVVQVPGAQTYTVAGRVEPGATVTISRNGGVAEAVATAPDGSFSKTYAAPAGGSSALSIPIEVVGTLAGAGDNGTDAVAAQERTIVLAPANMATSYGAHGAIAEDWRWIYRWDPEGRLSGMETRVGAVTAGMANVRMKFAYDDRGRRIGKTVQYKSADGLTIERTVTSKFIYDGWRLLAEEINDSAASGTVARHYTWGKDLSGTLEGTGGVGGLLAIHQEGVSYVPVYDGNGNITGLVNAAGGAQVAFWSRGPFGEPISATGDTSLCPFGFATAYTDSETGLVYFGHRFYLPVSGRWLSREPLGETESFNLYAYCHNDPVNKVDVLGLAEVSINQADKNLIDLAFRYGLISEDAGPNAAIDINILNACLVARGQVPIEIIGGRTAFPCLVCHGRGARGSIDGVSRLYSMIGGNVYSSSGHGDVMRKIGAGAWGNVRALGKDLGNSIAFMEYGIVQPIGEWSGLWDWAHPSVATMPFDADGSRRAGHQQVYPGIDGDNLLVGAGGSFVDGALLLTGPETILKASSFFTRVPGWSVRTIESGIDPNLAIRLEAFSAWKARKGYETVTTTQFRRFMGGHRPRSAGVTFYSERSGFADWSRRVESVHGNTAGSQLAWLYRLETSSGDLLKWGVSANPAARYSTFFMRGKELIPVQVGPRSIILQMERRLIESYPGPLNLEPWAGSSNLLWNTRGR